MDDIIDDAIIDAIDIRWVPGSDSQYTDATVPEFEGSRMLRSFLSRTFWTGLLFLAEGVVDHESRDVNDSGFRFGADDDDDTPPDEDDDEDDDDTDDEPVVHVYNPFDTVTMSEGAFVRLMARLCGAIADGAVADGNDVVGQDWWPRFVEVTAEIRSLAA